MSCVLNIAHVIIIYLFRIVCLINPFDDIFLL